MISLDVRFDVLARANGRCEHCGATPAGKGSRGLHLHHTEYLAVDTPGNLIALCPKCHRIRHCQTRTRPRPVPFNVKLTPDAIRLINELRARKGISITSILEMAIREFAERELPHDVFAA